MVWNRVVFWHQLCSASFSTWCLNRSQKTLTMTVLYTSATVLTAICLTSGDCMPTQTLEQLFHDHLFTDDTALVAHIERALQHLTSCFAEAAQLFGLEVSLKKTEVLHQPAPLEEYLPPHITIGGTELKSVHLSGVYQHIRHRGCPRGVMVKAMNCGIVVREFVLQSRYYVHFLILPPAMGK